MQIITDVCCLSFPLCGNPSVRKPAAGHIDGCFRYQTKMPKKIEKTEQLKFFDVNFRFLKHDLEKDHFSRREVAATMVTENSIESQENGEIPSKKNMFHPDKDDDQRLLRLIEGK